MKIIYKELIIPNIIPISVCPYIFDNSFIWGIYEGNYL